MPTHGVIDTTEIRQRERLASPACLKSVAFAMHLPDWLNNTGRLLARAAAQMLLWLGWAYLTKTMRKPQRGGVNFDPPIICCACSMQNVPTADKMFQMSSYLVLKLFT
jgi:hypothetical protein